MRNAVTLLAFAALSPLCAALPVGVGIDSDQRIRVPIPITKSLLVEPALGWEADRYSYGQTLVKSSGAHIGLGIFYLNATEANSELTLALAYGTSKLARRRLKMTAAGPKPTASLPPLESSTA